MDSNRATAQFYQAHPNWFAVDVEGEPYRAGDRYVACVNGPYYKTFLPDVLREVIERYHPEGFTDNSWTGLNRRSICYCDHCREQFHDATGLDLPRQPDWDDEAYRRWVKWSYACRVTNWELNNRVTRDAGGSGCLFEPPSTLGGNGVGISNVRPASIGRGRNPERHGLFCGWSYRVE